MGSDFKSSTVQEKQKSGWTPQFLGLTFACLINFTGIAASMTSLNSPAKLVEEFLNKTEYDRTGSPMSESEISSQFGLLQAMIGIGALFGCITVNYLGNWLGKKKGTMAATVTGLLGSVLSFCARPAEIPELLFVGRVFIGVTIGWGLIALVYVMESCETDKKRLLGNSNVLFLGAGMILAPILGFQEILANEDYWHYLTGFPAIIFGLELIGLFFCPESPRDLVLKYKDEEKAREAFRFLRGRDNVEKDIQLIYQELEESTIGGAQISIKELFTNRSLRWPMIIGLVLGLQQNWNGSASVLFFSTTLFEDAGLSDKEAKYATTGNGATFLFGSLIGTVLLQRFGRKTIFMFASFIIGIACTAMALALIFKDDVEAMVYISIAALYVIGLFHAGGPFNTYFVLLNEIFPYSARSFGLGFASAASFVGQFLHNYLFPLCIDSIGPYTFLIFTGGNLAIIVFFFFFVPETKDRSFHEILISMPGADKSINADLNGDQTKAEEGLKSNYDSTATVDRRGRSNFGYES